MLILAALIVLLTLEERCVLYIHAALKLALDVREKYSAFSRLGISRFLSRECERYEKFSLLPCIDTNCF